MTAYFIRTTPPDPVCIASVDEAGMPTYASIPATAQKYPKKIAEREAQRLALWWVACGYPKPARQLRLYPATGGAATGWRAAIE